METMEITTNGVIKMEQLTRPFEPAQIMQRKGRFGQMLDYVGSQHVIERLNAAFEGHWSFRILERIILDEEVIVLGELSAHGIVHQQFGGSSITRTKEGNQTVSLGDDLKAASSDCLKKCATQFGVGLHLYGLEPKSQVNGPQPQNNQPAPIGREEGKITNDQVARIFQIAKQKGIAQAVLLQNVRSKFGKPVSGLTSTEANDLINRLSSMTQ